MLLTTEHITKVHDQGIEYLSNIVTNKFYRRRYGLQIPAASDTDLLLLTWAVSRWDNREGASNPYTQCQLLGLLENILRKGKDLLACFTCQSTGTTVDKAASTGGDEPTPPPPVDKVTVKWGYFSSDPGDATTVTLPQSVTITTGNDYTLPTRQVSTPSWVVIEEPSTEPMKTKWYNTALNQGTISSTGTQSWLATVESGGKRYYKTRSYLVLDDTADTKFSKT